MASSRGVLQLRAGTAGEVARLWFLTIVGNVVTWAIVLSWGDAGALGGVALLFAALSIVFATFQTMARRKFGESVLEVPAKGPELGSRLEGTITTRIPLQPSKPIQLVLECVRERDQLETDSDGWRTRTRTDVMARQVLRVPIGAIRWSPEQTIIPVSIIVPRGGFESGPAKGGGEILWRLKVHADLPGLDYRATFGPIPVGSVPGWYPINRHAEE